MIVRNVHDAGRLMKTYQRNHGKWESRIRSLKPERLDLLLLDLERMGESPALETLDPAMKKLRDMDSRTHSNGTLIRLAET